MNQYGLLQSVALTRLEELRQTGRRAPARHRKPQAPDPQAQEHAVTMRVASDADDARIAGVPRTDVPQAPVLVGELAGRAIAAVSLADGEIVAARLQASDDVVALLRLRASQLAGSGERRIA